MPAKLSPGLPNLEKTVKNVVLLSNFKVRAALHSKRSWTPLGGLLGANLDALWVHLAALVTNLGPTWTLLGPTRGQLGRTWGQLGRTWGPLGRSWGQLGRSWGQLGASRASFELNLELLGVFLDSAWSFWGCFLDSRLLTESAFD